ncbi:uncharacterized protein LOC128127816 [Lactuca sativa]|uniref:uncharacterized protein LOC128127816 n=1 Tax=Lactuca sativa TaxID=4236 RepID=UPI0022AF0465|nr:uncharacterized protein LOC128127816 [Lactuca sativa]
MVEMVYLECDFWIVIINDVKYKVGLEQFIGLILKSRMISWDTLISYGGLKNDHGGLIFQPLSKIECLTKAYNNLMIERDMKKGNEKDLFDKYFISLIENPNDVLALQFVEDVLEIEQRGKLSSQTEKNPNVSAITLRSGKILGESQPKRVSREAEDEVIIVEPPKVVVPPKEPVVPNVDQPGPSNKPIKSLVIPPPFPSWLASSKKQEEEKEFLETFRKVQLNISLLDAIKQIPRYAKFLKDLCTNKRKFKTNEKIQVNANVSTFIQKKLPPKCKDPGMFAIPCTIGDLHVESAMLDLGASINVMPYSVFQSLNVGPLEETRVIIQLADKSSVFPRGMLEDVLVQVNQLIFPADFYVIDLEDKTPSKSSMILLGRPFMHTAHTIIDVHKGKITMEFDGETIHFNIFEGMRYPSNISPLYRVDVIEPINRISPNVCTDNIIMEDDCNLRGNLKEDWILQ